MKYDLVDKSDPILYQPTKEFDFQNPPFNAEEFATNLVETMFAKSGLGLAANQVGFPYAIFAMRGEPENFVMFNPRVVQPSEELIELDEACLTYPFLIVPMKRSRHVRVRFNGPDGDTYTKTFADMSARIFQHEMCHLKGKPFWDGISKLKFDMAVKKAYKKNFDYKRLTFKGI